VARECRAAAESAAERTEQNKAERAATFDALYAAASVVIMKMMWWNEHAVMGV
jgi:hypothetical protein